MPRPEEKATELDLRKIYMDLYTLNEDYYQRINVRESSNPVLFKIKTLVSTEEGRSKIDEIAKLCFDYLMENKSMAYSKSRRAGYDAVLNTLGAVDIRLADYVEEVVNNDRVMKKRVANSNGQIKKLNVRDLFNKNNTTWHSRNDRINNQGKASADPRLENLNELLKRFKSKEVSPWHHFNTGVYEKMIKSIERTIEYAKAIEKGAGSEGVLDKMLEEVKTNTLNYLDKKSDTPDSKYGQARVNLALATLLSVDKEKGMEAVKDNANMKYNRAVGYRNFLAAMGEDVSKMKFNKSTFMSLDKIIKETGFKDYELNKTDIVTRDSMIQAMAERLGRVAGEVNSSEFGIDYPELAEYIVCKSMYDKLQVMTEEESKMFDVAEAELKNQLGNVLMADAFMITCDRMIGDDIFKNINPDTFYVSFKVVIVEMKNAEMEGPAAAKASRTNTNNNQSKVETLEDKYKEIKNFMHMEDASFDEVRKAVKWQLAKNHPDKVHSEDPQEIEKHNKLFNKLNDFKTLLENNADKLREMDANIKPEQVEVPKYEAPALGGLGM